MIKLKQLIKESEDFLNLKFSVENLEKELEKKYPQLDNLSIYLRHYSSLFIGSIRVKSEYRGQGVGRSVINDIKKFADDNNLVIVLSPEPQRGYKKNLERFYKNLGFVDNKGRKKDFRYSSFFGKTMLRYPTNKK